MAKKKEQQELRFPQTKMGKYSGYTLLENGDILVAPMYRERISELVQRRNAVNALMKSVVDHCAELLHVVYKGEQQFWRDVGDDYGIDVLENQHSIDAYDGKIRAKPKAEEKK